MASDYIKVYRKDRNVTMPTKFGWLYGSPQCTCSTLHCRKLESKIAVTIISTSLFNSDIQSKHWLSMWSTTIGCVCTDSTHMYHFFVIPRLLAKFTKIKCTTVLSYTYMYHTVWCPFNTTVLITYLEDTTWGDLYQGRHPPHSHLQHEAIACGHPTLPGVSLDERET